MLRKKIVNEIIGEFSGVVAIVDFSGSSAGDIDLLIISGRKLPANAGKKLGRLRKRFGSEADLDLSCASLSSIGRWVTAFGSRDAHGLDIYRLKRGTVIFGSRKILAAVPALSLRQALKDVLPHVKSRFIAEIGNELAGVKDTADYVQKKSGVFCVIARSIYSIDTGKVGTKIEALRHVGRKYPGTLPLTGFLEENMKDAGDVKITKVSVRRLLKAAGTSIDDFLSGK